MDDPKTYLKEDIINLNVPITFMEFKGPEFDNYSLESIHSDVTDIIRTTGDVQKRTTNVKAHMTKWLMTEYLPFKIISDHVENIVQAYYYTKTDLKIETFMTTCWGAIYKKGDHSEPHAHVPALWSWVYYVKANEKSAPLVFVDSPGHTYHPRSGYGIIFPGWLMHMVPPHEGDDERIIVVGNVEGTGSVGYPQKNQNRFLHVSNNR